MVTAGVQKLEIPIEAELVSKSAVAAPPGGRVAPSPGPDDGSALQAAEGEQEPAVGSGSSVLPSEFLVELRPFKDVKITELSATGATIEWPAVAGDAGKFRVERRRVVPKPGGGLGVRWEELPGTKLRREGEKNIAVLTGLRPTAAYAVRVISVVPGNEAGETLFTQHFATPAKRSLWPKVTPFRALLVMLLLCVGLVLRQRRAQSTRG